MELPGETSKDISPARIPGSAIDNKHSSTLDQSTLDPNNCDQITLLKRILGIEKATNDQVQYFLIQAKRTKLDPFTRQIYAFIKSDGKLIVGTTIDGFRLIASRTGLYAGQRGPQWCGEDGIWKDVWLSDIPPCAARVYILHKEFDEPIQGIAHWKEFCCDNYMWKKYPCHQLAKCAEALGLRKALPQELSGLYTEDEMEIANDDIQIPDKFLPKELQGKNITILSLANETNEWVDKGGKKRMGLDLLEYLAKQKNSIGYAAQRMLQEIKY